MEDYIVLYILTIALSVFFGVTGVIYSQEIPGDVRKIMEQLQTDSLAEYGFNFAKKYRFINSDVGFKDWFVGLPIEFYELNGDALEKAELNSDIMSLIISYNIWRIPIRIHGEYAYYVEVFGENGEFRSGGAGEKVLDFQIWDRIRDKFPEESGIRPIVIGWAFGKFIHFPNKKDGKSLFYVRNPKWDGDLSKITSKSLDSLDEDKKIINYWKSVWSKNKEKRRKFLEENPGLFKEKSGGNK